MSDENRKQLSNKAEHVWLSCFRAALNGVTAGPLLVRGELGSGWGDLRRELCRGIVERDDAEGIRRAYPCAELRPSEATP